jgi:HD-like signal output (HDOD) protein
MLSGAMQYRKRARNRPPAAAQVPPTRRDPLDELELIARSHPALERRLLRCANTAGRRALYRITDVRTALVRLGLRTASDVLLEAALELEGARSEAAAAHDRAA